MHLKMDRTDTGAYKIMKSLLELRVRRPWRPDGTADCRPVFGALKWVSWPFESTNIARMGVLFTAGRPFTLSWSKNHRIRPLKASNWQKNAVLLHGFAFCPLFWWHHKPFCYFSPLFWWHHKPFWKWWCHNFHFPQILTKADKFQQVQFVK